MSLFPSQSTTFLDISVTAATSYKIKGLCLSGREGGREANELNVILSYSPCLLAFIHKCFLRNISVLLFCHPWNDINNGVQQSVYRREHHPALFSNMMIFQYCSFIFFLLLGYICFDLSCPCACLETSYTAVHSDILL